MGYWNESGHMIRKAAMTIILWENTSEILLEWSKLNYEHDMKIKLLLHRLLKDNDIIFYF